MAGLFVKKGDTVVVLSGKDRGVKGKVLLTSPANNRVLVEGVNRVKKHTRIRTPPALRGPISRSFGQRRSTVKALAARIAEAAASPAASGSSGMCRASSKSRTTTLT